MLFTRQDEQAASLKYYFLKAKRDYHYFRISTFSHPHSLSKEQQKERKHVCAALAL
jgi:hypothetical protein